MAEPENRNVGWSFPLSFTVEGSVRKIGGVSTAAPTEAELRTAIFEDARHLMATGKGERVMHPVFGVDTVFYLFSPLYSRQPALLGAELAEQFSLWVDRVRVRAYQASIVPERGTIRVAVDFESLEYPLESTFGMEF